MSDQQGRHSADPGPHTAEPAGQADQDPRDRLAETGPAAAYARPDGVDGGFATHVPPASYRPPPPTVSPEDRAEFGRPADTGAFAPSPGQRLAPRVTPKPPVPQLFAEAFGTPPGGSPSGFAPAPGSRVDNNVPVPQSPWWQPNAPRDPWRDPTSPFWLGRGAVFAAGAPAQLDPTLDTETRTEDDLLDTGEDEELDDGPAERLPANVRRVRFGMRTWTAMVLVAVLAGGVGGLVGWLVTNSTHDALHRPDVSIAQVQTPVTRPPTSVAGIAKRVGPAVVSIAVKTPTEYGIGSGVVIDGQGDVLTNNHVISSAIGVKNASIVVTFSNEDTAKAQVVGHDPISDLAVIKVPDDQLTVATLGDSNEVAVGDPVIAIGSPLGLQGTVTAGIISALDRPVHVSSEDGSSDAYLDAIQTDAPINFGNSGGALVNSSGAVIGINSAAALGSVGPSGSQSTPSGIGYAIPINYAHKIATELIQSGTATHGSLGAVGSTALSGLEAGAYIKQISPGGPADKAGLHRGDVIIAADGQVVQSFDQLTVIVQEHSPGQKISVTYYRNDSSDKVTTTITLG